MVWLGRAVKVDHCECCSVFSFSSLEIEDLVSKTFPVLLGRLGDSAPRVVQQAIETIMELLKNNSLAVTDALFT